MEKVELNKCPYRKCKAGVKYWVINGAWEFKCMRVHENGVDIRFLNKTRFFEFDDNAKHKDQLRESITLK